MLILAFIVACLFLKMILQDEPPDTGFAIFAAVVAGVGLMLFIH
jgi:hypothetical protein